MFLHISPNELNIFFVSCLRFQFLLHTNVYDVDSQLLSIIYIYWSRPANSSYRHFSFFVVVMLPIKYIFFCHLFQNTCRIRTYHLFASVELINRPMMATIKSLEELYHCRLKIIAEPKKLKIIFASVNKDCVNLRLGIFFIACYIDFAVVAIFALFADVYFLGLK